jgi:hypothetical protein
VKSGKTLTAAERKTLEQAAGSEDELPPELVTTTRLAELFQVNRKTIAQWRLEKRPGIPAKVGNKEPLAEWRAYFAANPSAGHYDGKPRKDREHNPTCTRRTGARSMSMSRTRSAATSSTHRRRGGGSSRWAAMRILRRGRWFASCRQARARAPFLRPSTAGSRRSRQDPRSTPRSPTRTPSYGARRDS